MRRPVWPSGRPRILVSDAWLANAGDGAIALATERRLRRLAPGAAILHAAYQGDLVGSAYPELELVPPLGSLVRLTRLLPEMEGWDREACEGLLDDADVVLSQGGGFAMEHYDPWERLRAWELVVERGIPIGLGPQSVGRFECPRERAILRRVYESAVVVSVREPESVANVTELGAPADRMILTADEAFSLFEPAERARADGRGIACVLSAHPWVSADGRVVNPGAAPEALHDLVRDLIRLSDGEHVTLLSTQQGLGHLGRGLEDDSELAVQVVRSLRWRERQRVRVLRGYLPPLECARRIAEHRALVSMRMHPAIFGLTQGVPTVLVSDAFKAAGTVAMLGLEAALVSEPGAAAERLGARLEGDLPDLDTARRRAALNDEVIRRVLAAAEVEARPGEVEARAG